MTYHGTDLMGETIETPSVDRMRELLEELTRADGEHPDVSLEHESGWCLSVFASGLVVWENVEGDGPPRHMDRVSRDKVLELWLHLSRGEIEVIEYEPWRPGYKTG